MITTILALLATTLPAASTPPSSLPVQRAEDAYAHAVVAHDRAALEHLLASDLTYAHASGLDQDRTAYIASTIAPGGIAGMTYRSKTIHVAGRIAYVHGVVVFDVGQPRVARYTSVWRRDAGQWRLVVWQNTPLPD